MKAFFYFLGLLGLLGSYVAQAQTIPNAGLETWVQRNGRELPANWQVTDDFYSYGTYNTGTTTKTTDAHSGSFAAKLVNVTIPSSTGSYPENGLLSAGSRTSPYVLRALNNLPIGGGVPYNTRPTQLQFYYKNVGVASDSAVVLVLLTRTVNGAPSTVGLSVSLLPPVSTYTGVTLNIQYDSNVTAAPDTAHITFSSGIARNIAITPSGLYIDDVSLTGAALATRADASTQAQLTVAPNPSPGGRFVLNSPDQPALAASPLQVLDALGRIVVQQPAQAAPGGQRELDLSNLREGVYLLRLDAKDGVIVRQLTVK